MRAQKVNLENVDDKLFETFREFGYDGATMEVLAKATGLKKASLYHRFPKGKQEMAGHTLAIAEQWTMDHIVSESLNKHKPIATRLSNMIASIDELYNGGSSNCLLRALSAGTDAEVFKEKITNCFNLFADGFANIGIESGLSADVAKENAKLINITVQGALVLAGATGDNNYFKRALKNISALFPL